MEIVIKLPEERYRAIKDVCKIAGWPMDWEAIFRDVFWEGLFRDVFWAIDGGRVLPKGHGRLIDADELYKLDREGWLCSKYAPFISTNYADVFAEIDNAPTIIKADGGDAE